MGLLAVLHFSLNETAREMKMEREKNRPLAGVHFSWAVRKNMSEVHYPRTQELYWRLSSQKTNSLTTRLCAFKSPTPPANFMSAFHAGKGWNECCCCLTLFLFGVISFFERIKEHVSINRYSYIWHSFHTLVPFLLPISFWVDIIVTAAAAETFLNTFLIW